MRGLNFQLIEPSMIYLSMMNTLLTLVRGMASWRRGIWTVVAAIGISGMAFAQSGPNMIGTCLPDGEADLWKTSVFAEKNWQYCNPDGSDATGQYGYFSKLIASQIQYNLQFQYLYQDADDLLTLVSLPVEGFLADDMIVTLGYGNRLQGDNELTQFFYRIPINVTASGDYDLTGCVRAANADTFTSNIYSDTDYIDKAKALVIVAVKETDGELTFEGETADYNTRVTGVKSAGEDRPFLAQRIYTNEEAQYWIDDIEWLSPTAKPFSTSLTLTPEYKYLRFYAPKSTSPVPNYPILLNQLSLKANVITGIESIDAPEPSADRYYNLQGMPVAEPGRGLNIRIRNGKSEKILL